jgi:serine/threonine-protein kinase
MSEASRQGDGSQQIRTGTRVDRYEVQDYLGGFSIGAAYRGYDRSSASSVAIVALDRLTSPEARERFASAAPKLVALRHPHVLRVIGFGVHGDVPYLVCDQFGGRSLADLMRGRPLDRGQVIWILGGIAGAVDEAHRSGIVHGDLTPSNVMIDPEGGPLVLGFGIAPLGANGHRPRASAPAMSTPVPEFTAPEEAATGTASAAADRYSFVVIAYEVVTGAKPSFGRPPDGEPNAELTLRPTPELGPATYNVLRRGLDWRPERRWASCTQMSEALARRSAATLSRRL